MKKLIFICCLLLSTLSLKAGIFQNTTNSFYKQGEMNIELAPTVTSSTPFNPHGTRNFGYSLEFEYWQTKNTGTGLEFGCYNLDEAQNGDIIDHISIMEDIRLITFDKPEYIFLNRFALELKLGTETYTSNDNKSLEFGLGIDYQITTDFRAQLSFMQQYLSNPANDQGTFRFGLQYIF